MVREGTPSTSFAGLFTESMDGAPSRTMAMNVRDDFYPIALMPTRAGMTGKLDSSGQNLTLGARLGSTDVAEIRQTGRMLLSD